MRFEETSKMIKIFNIGIVQKDGKTILHGWARRLDLPGHEVSSVYAVNAVYALLHPEVDQTQKLILIDLWNDPNIKVAGEEYVGDDHPLIKKLAAFKLNRPPALEICGENSMDGSRASAR